METNVYNTQGKKVSSLKLPEAIFALPFNSDLVHQVVLAQEANARENIAHTKDRGAVRGGGRKPWRQKGTGRARHGSSRSPIWRGGGVTFGPTNERNFTQKVNKKMKRKALYLVLAQKLRDNEIIFVDSLGISEVKTKSALEIVKGLVQAGFDRLVSKTKNTALVVTPEKTEEVYKSFRNLPGFASGEIRSLNVLDLLRYKYLVVEDGQKLVDFLSPTESKSIKKEEK